MLAVAAVADLRHMTRATVAAENAAVAVLAVATVANSCHMTRATVAAKNAAVAVLAVAAVADLRHMTRATVAAENAAVIQQSLARQTGLTADRLDDSTRSNQQQDRTHHTTNDPDL